MMGEEFRLGGGKFWEAFRQDGGNACVQLLPRTAQQRAVGRFLHQRVLECIDRIGRRAPAVDQLRGNELVERVTQLALGSSEMAAINSCENSRPMAAPISAIFRAGARRSSRAISDACSVVGIERGGNGTVSP